METACSFETSESTYDLCSVKIRNECHKNKNGHDSLISFSRIHYFCLITSWNFCFYMKYELLNYVVKILPPILGSFGGLSLGLTLF
jgi:hypothetical protein